MGKELRQSSSSAGGGRARALIAQQVFRHKTRKVSYQVLFWVIVLLHEVFWLDQLFLGGTLLSIF